MIIYRKKCKDLVIPVGLGPNVSEITGYDLQSKTVDSSTVEQFITSDVNFYGLYSVTVRLYILDAKTVDSSTVQQVVTSDASALYQVIVNPYTLESKSQTITQNGEYSFTPESADGISRVDISVNVADIPAVVQTKSVTYTENGEYSVEPDAGYDGLSHVDISVEVPDVPTELQDKTVYPSTSSITVEPDQGYDGLSSVTVAAIDSSLDPDLQPENIKKDVEIFGVTGTFEGQEINNQTKTVDSSTTIQYVQSDQGYTGLDYVAVNPYVLDSKTVNPSTNSQTVTSDEDGLSSVTVNAVTAAIDPDLVPGNIKKDVEILGVTGTFEGGTLQSKSVNSSTSSQTVTPDGDNYGLSQVTVNPYTVESKSQTITVNGQYSFAPTNANALSGVSIDVSVADIPAVVQSKSVSYTANGQYNVTPDSGYDGLSSVSIDVSIDNAPELQSKTVNSSTSSQTVSPDQGYDGLSQVTVNPYSLENKTVNSSTSQQTISADNGYDGLNVVTVEPYVLDSKTVNPSTNSQTVTSSEDGLSSVTVNAVTAAIDPDLVPGNIKKDVEILGVTGTYEGGTINNQNKTVNSSTVSQSIIADQGYTGLGTVTVNPYTLDSSTVDPSSNQIVVTSNADGLSSVTVNAVNSIWPSETITRNGFYSISAQNWGYDFFDGVDIDVSVDTGNLQTKTVNSSTSSQTITPDYGYTALSQVTVNPYRTETKTQTIFRNGTYTIIPTNADALSSVTVDVDTVNNQNKTVNPSTNSQSVTADSGYTGLGTVTVNAVTASIDSNIQAGNIKDGVTILGVQGTYTGSGSGGNEYTYIHLDNSVESSLAGSGTGMQISGVNPWLIVMCGGSPSSSTGYSYTLLNKFCTIVNNRPSCVSVTNTVSKITYICKEIRMTSPSEGNAICSSTVTPDVAEIEFPDLHSVPYSIANWITPWRDVKLTVHWKALRESVQNRNVTSNLGSYLKELVIEPWDGAAGEQYINEDIHLDWSPSLNYASVLGVFSRLSSTDPHTVTFYTGGLIVYDDAQGSIQTAYDTVTAAGWTIENLIIMPNLIDTTTDLTSLGNNLTSSQIEELLNHVDTTYVIGRTLTFATGSNYEAESYSSSLYQKYVNLGTTSGWNLQNLFVGYPDYTGWSSDGKYRHYEFDFGTGQRNAVIESDYEGYSSSYMEHVGTAISYYTSNNICLETNDGGKTTATIGAALGSTDKIESSTNNTSGTHTTAFGVLDDGRMILKPRADGTGLVISETTSGMVQAGSSNLRLPCKDFRFDNNTRGWNILGFRVWHNWGTTGDRSDNATLVHDVVHIKDFQWRRYKMHDRVTDRWYDLIVENS
jgi:hypothetical protein